RDLRPPAAGVEHRERLFQPPADGAVDKSATRFAVAGIVEADTGSAMALRPLVECDRLGALHVGIEAGQPEQAGFRASTGPHRYSARRRADFEERHRQFACPSHGCAGSALEFTIDEPYRRQDFMINSAG